MALATDLVLLSVIEIVLGDFYGVTRVTGGTAPQSGAAGVATFTTSIALDWPWLLALSLAYFTVMEQLFGATVGKLIFGVCVVSQDGGRASWRQIASRNIVRVVDALPILYLVGGISVLATARHQRVGDRIARTVVAPRASAPSIAHVGRSVAAFVALVIIATIVSLGFDYYGRPPLVIQGMANTGQLRFGQLTPSGYELGQPTFSGGFVTYPIRYHRAGQPDCNGTLELEWHGFRSGWAIHSAETHC